MNEYFDDLETRDPEAREATQFAAVAAQIAHAKANAPYFTALLADVEASTIDSRRALAALPVTRKSELSGKQKDSPPFAGMTTGGGLELARIFQSPGPIYDPQGATADFFRTARAFHAAGFRAGDLVHNTFSYHLTPGGFIMDSGARAVGCTVIPGGVGNTEQQLDVIQDLRPNGYSGTPSFLKILLDKAAETGKDASGFAKAMVGGEYFPPPLREEWKGMGIAAYQSYVTADVGLIAYETPALEGMVVDEGIVVEIVRPGTGDPLPEGEVGEVVVTTFCREYPLIRFATGDLSAVLSGTSPCGRTSMRLKGWMGRADQTTKVKGMFVHPSQVAEVVKRHPEVARARLVITRDDAGKDVMTLHCEAADADSAAIAATLQSVTKIKGLTEIAAPGTLANDGLVIEDARSYE